jgi:hypothetical protein
MIQTLTQKKLKTKKDLKIKVSRMCKVEIKIVSVIITALGTIKR